MIKTKPATLNKRQALIAERIAKSKAKMPSKPKKDRSEAKAAYAEAKAMGVDYNIYKYVAARRKRPCIDDD